MQTLSEPNDEISELNTAVHGVLLVIVAIDSAWTLIWIEGISCLFNNVPLYLQVGLNSYGPVKRRVPKKTR